MTNAARGESAITLGGVSYDLALTLGALAELETAFDATGLNDVLAKMSGGTDITAPNLIKTLKALLIGNGVEFTPEVERAIRLTSPLVALGAIQSVLSVSGLVTTAETDDREATEDSAPLPPPSAGASG